MRAQQPEAYAARLAQQQAPSRGGGHEHSLMQSDDGEIYSFGSGGDGRLGHGAGLDRRESPMLIEALRGERVCAVAAGATHSLCVLQSGRVLGWGCGTDERLGLRLGAHQHTPLEYPSLRAFV